MYFICILRYHNNEFVFTRIHVCTLNTIYARFIFRFLEIFRILGMNRDMSVSYVDLSNAPTRYDFLSRRITAWKAIEVHKEKKKRSF